MTGTASGVKSREWGHCLFVHVQCAIPLILSSGMPTSGLDVMMGMGQKVEQYVLADHTKIQNG